MQMSRDTKSYKGNKKDQYTIVLEDLRNQFGFFGEALQFTNQNIVEINQNIVEIRSELSSLNQRTGRLEMKVDVLSSDVYVLKNDMSVVKSDIKEIKTILNKNDDKFDDHEERIGHLETA